MNKNEVMNGKGDFLTNPQAITSEIVRKYLDPKKLASDGELAFFVAQAKSMNLNPFTNEIYFIKYSQNQNAQIVVAQKAFEKTADAHPQYDGMDSGIIYEIDGEIKRSEGAFLPRNADILGAWACVYRKDRSHPVKAEVTFDEYDNSKIRKQGPTDRNGKPTKPNTWDEKPATMIHKVARVAALRSAFPNELGGLYEADELGDKGSPKDVTPQESQDEVRARKMAEIEAYKAKKEEAEKLESEIIENEELADKVPAEDEANLLSDGSEVPF